MGAEHPMDAAGTHLGVCVRSPPPRPHGLLRCPERFGAGIGGVGPDPALAAAVRLSPGPFRGLFGGFWRFLALRAVCSLSGEGAGGCPQATVSVSPLCPLVYHPRDGSPWVRLTLGTGHPKDGPPWGWVTRGPANVGDRSGSPWGWVTPRTGHPGDRSPQIQLTPGMGHPMSR